jgi:hypothetical protein
MKKVIFALVVLIIGISSSAEEPSIEPGMWEWSVTMEMPGMPFQMPPTTYSSCITKEDLVPNQTDSTQQCKMLHNKATKSGVEWKIECTSEAGKTLSIGKIAYKSTTAKGKIEIQTNGMNMTSKIDGRRTGVCR